VARAKLRRVREGARVFHQLWPGENGVGQVRSLAPAPSRSVHPWSALHAGWERSFRLCNLITKQRRAPPESETYLERKRSGTRRLVHLTIPVVLAPALQTNRCDNGRAPRGTNKSQCFTYRCKPGEVLSSTAAAPPVVSSSGAARPPSRTRS